MARFDQSPVNSKLRGRATATRSDRRGLRQDLQSEGVSTPTRASRTATRAMRYAAPRTPRLCAAQLERHRGNLQGEHSVLRAFNGALDHRVDDEVTHSCGRQIERRFLGKATYGIRASRECGPGLRPSRPAHGGRADLYLALGHGHQSRSAEADDLLPVPGRSGPAHAAQLLGRRRSKGTGSFSSRAARSVTVS
jgi:hypothetical protein